MKGKFTIRVVEALEAFGITMCEFTADVSVNWHLACGNDWDEPREPAHGELSGVRQVSGPYIEPDKLSAWAHDWMDANERRVEEEACGLEPF